MGKSHVVYCSKCQKLTKHTYVGRNRDSFLRKIVFGVLTLGINPLYDLALEEKVLGETYWECTECKTITED